MRLPLPVNLSIKKRLCAQQLHLRQVCTLWQCDLLLRSMIYVHLSVMSRSDSNTNLLTLVLHDNLNNVCHDLGLCCLFMQQFSDMLAELVAPACTHVMYDNVTRGGACRRR